MAKYTKISVSVPSDLLVLARSSQLQAPDEPLSNFIARLLREALDRRDDEAYRHYSLTPEEEAVSEAMLRASVEAMAEELAADRNEYSEWKARRTKKKARAAR
jgi:hypothetical protein